MRKFWLEEEAAMGMQFNTGATLDVGRAVNEGFGSGILQIFRADMARWQQTFSQLPAAGPHNPGGGTYNLVMNYLPKQIAPSDHGHWNNWKTWLSFFDTQYNSRSARANQIVANFIGQEISNVIGNGKYSAIEFYIVPDGAHTTISAEASDFPPQGGDNLIRTITIYTNTFDALRGRGQGEVHDEPRGRGN
jgi:hypothetical protein